MVGRFQTAILVVILKLHFKKIYIANANNVRHRLTTCSHQIYAYSQALHPQIYSNTMIGLSMTLGF